MLPALRVNESRRPWSITGTRPAAGSRVSTQRADCLQHIGRPSGASSFKRVTPRLNDDRKVCLSFLSCVPRDCTHCIAFLLRGRVGVWFSAPTSHFPLDFRWLRCQRLFLPRPGSLHPPSSSIFSVGSGGPGSSNFPHPDLISQTGTRNFPLLRAQLPVSPRLSWPWHAATVSASSHTRHGAQFIIIIIILVFFFFFFFFPYDGRGFCHMMTLMRAR